MKRLNASTAAQLATAVLTPEYDRTQLRTGIVHLGPGAFFRAHLAEYTDSAMTMESPDWGIHAFALRTDTAVQQLQPQDGLFTRTVRDGARLESRLIGCLSSCQSAAKRPAAAVSAIADTRTRIISLTITEKGYSAPVADDRDSGNATELLLAGLARRRQINAGGVTLLSCDNLSGNGSRLRQLLTSCAQTGDPALAEWIDSVCRFPNSMVDRIVPASRSTDIDTLAARIGLRDEAAVFTEGFSQWVIEDDFAGRRPQWEQAGALLVQDVTPFEHMKLRLLNASHSCIAWYGQLTGLGTVDQVIADPLARQWLALMMRNDATPTLNMPAGFDIGNYSESLLQRFANENLAHSTEQIATDSSQKISQRLVPVIDWHRQRGKLPAAACFALGLWFHYLGAKTETGDTITIHDPLAQELQAAASNGVATAVPALISDRRVFPESFSSDRVLIDVITGVLGELRRLGTRSALQAALIPERERYA